MKLITYTHRYLNDKCTGKAFRDLTSNMQREVWKDAGDKKKNKEHGVDIRFLLYIILNCFSFVKYMCFFEVKIKIYSNWKKNMIIWINAPDSLLWLNSLLPSSVVSEILFTFQGPTQSSVYSLIFKS